MQRPESQNVPLYYPGGALILTPTHVCQEIKAPRQSSTMSRASTSTSGPPLHDAGHVQSLTPDTQVVSLGTGHLCVSGRLLLQNSVDPRAGSKDQTVPCRPQPTERNSRGRRYRSSCPRHKRSAVWRLSARSVPIPTPLRGAPPLHLLSGTGASKAVVGPARYAVICYQSMHGRAGQHLAQPAHTMKATAGRHSDWDRAGPSHEGLHYVSSAIIVPREKVPPLAGIELRQTQERPIPI
ncbi:hypothetical protein NDU88_004611 [Pleurodeles waltl]|uniref:Uncharacterized protein n=1 Tax=Pleurodeles waltl TaxID=8319 RepID=A0AAV7T8V7_PLEWA|nr:hypothetical protein NDU88_004611 [Pleurodeles waltl]